MAETIKVSVLQEDIDQGKHESCGECPLALAINRCVGGGPWKVGPFSFWREQPGMACSRPLYRLTPAAVNFVRDFDNRRAAVPFEFEVTLLC